MTSDLTGKYTFFSPISENQGAVSIKNGLCFYGKIKRKEIFTVFFRFPLSFFGILL